MYTISNLLKTDKTVFSSTDMAYVWGIENPNTLKKTISYLSSKGKIKQIRKGLYYLDGRNYDLFELANKYRTPSYISLTTILQQSGVVFQYSEEVYLVSNRSSSFSFEKKSFIYRQIKDDILYNPSGLIKEKNYTMATTERAFLDMLYLERNFYFDNLNPINFDKCIELLSIYNNKNLEKKVLELKERKRNNA